MYFLRNRSCRKQFQVQANSAGQVYRKYFSALWRRKYPLSCIHLPCSSTGKQSSSSKKGRIEFEDRISSSYSFRCSRMLVVACNPFSPCKCHDDFLPHFDSCIVVHYLDTQQAGSSRASSLLRQEVNMCDTAMRRSELEKLEEASFFDMIIF